MNRNLDKDVWDLLTGKLEPMTRSLFQSIAIEGLKRAIFNMATNVVSDMENDVVSEGAKQYYKEL